MIVSLKTSLFILAVATYGTSFAIGSGPAQAHGIVLYPKTDAEKAVQFSNKNSVTQAERAEKRAQRRALRDARRKARLVKN